MKRTYWEKQYKAIIDLTSAMAQNQFVDTKKEMW